MDEKIYDWFCADINSPQAGWKRRILVKRSISDLTKLRVYACCCPEDTPLTELVRVAAIHWTVEMCFSESKGDVGLDHYEVRGYNGWYKHITMAICAHALLSVLKAHEQDISYLVQIATPASGSLTAFKRARFTVTISKTELRKLIWRLLGIASHTWDFLPHWLNWRLRHQAVAMACHYRKHRVLQL